MASSRRSRRATMWLRRENKHQSLSPLSLSRSQAYASGSKHLQPRSQLWLLVEQLIKVAPPISEASCGANKGCGGHRESQERGKMRGKVFWARDCWWWRACWLLPTVRPKAAGYRHNSNIKSDTEEQQLLATLFGEFATHNSIFHHSVCHNNKPAWSYRAKLARELPANVRGFSSSSLLLLLFSDSWEASRETIVGRTAKNLFPACNFLTYSFRFSISPLLFSCSLILVSSNFWLRVPDTGHRCGQVRANDDSSLDTFGTKV